MTDDIEQDLDTQVDPAEVQPPLPPQPEPPGNDEVPDDGSN